MESLPDPASQEKIREAVWGLGAMGLYYAYADEYRVIVNLMEEMEDSGLHGESLRYLEARNEAFANAKAAARQAGIPYRRAVEELTGKKPD